jgi:hypothetical protein
MTKQINKEVKNRGKMSKQGRTSKTSLLIAAFLLFITSFTFIKSPDLAHAAACPTPATSYGTDTMSTTLTNATTYTVWVEMQTASSADNSIDLQIDGTTCYVVGGSSSMALNTWDWIKYQGGNTSDTMQISLTAASHTLELIGTEPGVEVNTIELLGDNTCVPTGTAGTNCTTGQPVTSSSPSATVSPTSTTKPKTTSPSPSASPSPITTTSTPITTSGKGGETGTTTSTGTIFTNGSDGTVIVPTQTTPGGGTNLQSVSNSNTAPVELSSPVTVIPNYSSTQTIQEVQYYLNNKKVYTATKSPYTYNLNTNKLSNGKYTLGSKTFYTSGQINTASETILVRHSFWKTAYISLINNLVVIVIVLAIIGIIIWQAIMHRRLVSKFYYQYIAANLSKYFGKYFPNHQAKTITPATANTTTDSLGVHTNPTVIKPNSTATPDSNVVDDQNANKFR